MSCGYSRTPEGHGDKTSPRPSLAQKSPSYISHQDSKVKHLGLVNIYGTQMGRTGEPPSLPTVPALLDQPPRPIRCQPQDCDDSPFLGKAISLRKSLTYMSLGSAQRTGSLHCFSSSWCLKAQKHHMGTKKTDKDKNLKVPESLQSQQHSTSHERKWSWTLMASPTHISQ